MTRQFVDSGKSKISVNVINPGWVQTDMGGQNATRLPAEGAAIIIQLTTIENPPNGKFLGEAGEIGWQDHF